MEKKDEVVGRSKEVVELVGRIMLGAVGLCYAAGLVSTNLYYGRYGVYTLSLIRLNYILAGLWWILPIFSLFLILFAIFHAVKERAFATGAPFKRQLLSGALIVASIVVPSTTLVFFNIRLRVADWVALIVGSLLVLGTLFACWFRLVRRLPAIRLEASQQLALFIMDTHSSFMGDT